MSLFEPLLQNTDREGIMRFKRKNKDTSIIVSLNECVIVAETFGSNSLCSKPYIPDNYYFVKSFCCKAEAERYFNSIKTKDYETLKSFVSCDFESITHSF